MQSTKRTGWKTILARFLENTWNKEVSVENFISGFRTNVEKISNLSSSHKLKRDFLLPQADLPQHKQRAMIGAARGNYDANRIRTALGNVYRNGSLTNSSHFNQGIFKNKVPGHSYVKHGNNRERRRGRRRRGGHQNGGVTSSGSISGKNPAFYVFKTSSSHNVPHAILLRVRVPTSLTRLRFGKP